VVKLALETFSPLSRRYSISIQTGNNRTVEVWAARQRRPTNHLVGQSCRFAHSSTSFNFKSAKQ
jgi:hypothetical protein